MSGPERERPIDPLDEYLAGDSELSRAYRRAGSDAAPAALDDAVLGAARAELAAAARPAPASRGLRRWQWPIALAATVVLSFSTILVLREDLAAQKDAMMATDESVALRESSDFATSASVDAIAPAAPAAEAGLEAKQRAQAQPVEADVLAPAGAPAAPPPAESARPPQPFPGRPGRADAIGRQQETEAVRESAATRERRDAPPASGSGAYAAPAMQDESLAEESGPQSATGAATAPTENEAMKSESAPAGAPLAVQHSERDASAESPQAWLERIRSLRSRGEVEQARRELERFRLAWPDYEVPEDLRKL